MGGDAAPLGVLDDVASDRAAAWRIVGSRRVKAGILVSLLAALLVLPPVGQRIIATGGINGDDEARYALMARDLLQRGAWFDLQVRGERTWEKPPLLPWLIAGFARLRGRVTEATAQAPIALATIVVILFTFLMGDRLFTPRAGLWAALILLTSYDFFGQSQQVLPDMLVVAFMTIAGWAFWRAVTEPLNHRPLVVFYVAVAWAVFAKGPLGLLALLSAAVWLVTEHGPRGAARRLRSPVGMGLFGLITVAWLGPFLSLGARDFVAHTIWCDWLTWYFGRPSPGDLLYAATVGFLPWVVLAPLVLPRAGRAWKVPAVRFALLWFAVPLVVLALAANQKLRYALSIYPGAALLVAWWADTHGGARTAGGRAVGWCALGGALVTSLALRTPAWWHRTMRLYLTDLSWGTVLPIIVGLGLMGVTLCWSLHAGRPAVLVYGVVAGMVGILGYGIWPYDHRYNDVWNFKGLVAHADVDAAGAEMAVFLPRPAWLSIDFYRARSPRSIWTVAELRQYLAGQDHPVCVLDLDTWRVLQRELPATVKVLEALKIGSTTLVIIRDGGGVPTPAAVSLPATPGRLTDGGI
jgi:4-amino-4-deoxy-L-arabinose transferase-like glycosyltransferase